MARQTQPPPDLEVALVGQGVTPQTVTIRHLQELLAATSEALSAISTEGQQKPVLPGLTAVRTGSAAYVMTAADARWSPTLDELVSAVKKRGAGYPIRLRSALAKLHRAGGKLARVRIARIDPLSGARTDETLVEAPVETEPPQVTYSTMLYGKVVGVDAYTDRIAVKLLLTDGGRCDLDATPEDAVKAGQLFFQPVVVHADVEWDAERQQESKWELKSIDAWVEGDLVAVADQISQDLASKGVRVDIDEWLRDLDD
jgi:hypothetical protein